jgi:cytosine deaminase
VIDLAIRNARLRRDNGAGLHTVTIADGRVVDTDAPDTDASGATSTIDAEGMLLTEAFVNGHLHLDKVYTLGMLGDAALANYHGEGMGGAMTAIELAAKVKENYDRSWIIENVRRACDLAVEYGTATIRAFADVDTTGKLEGVAALLEARAEYRGRLELEVVAFPQDGLLRDPGAEELVEEAVRMGADCVGGIPWIEFTDEEAKEHVDRMVALAARHDRSVSMLVDDAGDANLRTLEYLAAATVREGLQGRVTAQHARAMALYPEPTFRRLVGQLTRAGIGVVSDPHTGPLHARVEQLLAAGIPVALGQDDISDAYYPLGRNNMLEVGFLAVHLLWMTQQTQMEHVYDMITRDAARVLGHHDRELEAGGVANLVVLDSSTVVDALRNHAAPRHVIHHGVLL